MAYSTKADIENRWSPEELLVVADRDGDGSISAAEEAAVIDPAIADADALIDARIGAKYPIPLPSTPPIVRQMSVDIAMWNMCVDESMRTELKTERFKIAVDTLKDIASGKADLGLATSIATEGVGAKIIAADEGSRVFTRESTRGVL